MTNLAEPFIGSEAIADGVLRKHQLRAGYGAIFPDVYATRVLNSLLISEPAPRGCGRIARES